MESLKTTSLFEEHVRLNAKMAPFAGYNMPIQYRSLKDEALAVRNHAGVFDVSHMGEFLVTGKEANDFVDYLVTNEIKSAPVGKAIYSPLCREDGTVIDDLIVYKLEEEKLLICVNASNIEKDWDWFQKHSKNFACTLKNVSESTSLLALQGPEAVKQLKNLKIFPNDIFDLAYYGVKELSKLGTFTAVARTGYTGEDGFEIFCDHELARKIWSSLIAAGVAPCGLGARDVLRLEVCYPLYGHEIDDTLTPLDSSLGWTVKTNKEKFIGKKALADYKAKYSLVKLTLEKAIPRQGYAIVNEAGDKIGQVTSGTLSVAINKGIALAHVLKKSLKTENHIFVDIREKKHQAEIQKEPFVKGGHK